MKVAAMGITQESTMRLSIEFTDAFEPLGYSFTLVTPAFRSDATGEVADGVLVTVLKTPGGERRERIPLGEDDDLFGLAELRRAAEGYTPGQVFAGSMFEPNLFGMVPYRIEILDTTVVRIGGVPTEVWRMRSTVGEISSTSLVDASGDLLRADGPMGIVMKRETEEEARDMTRAGNVTDLIAAFSIPAGMDVPDPSTVRSAVLAVEGLDSVPYGGGVQAVSSPDASGVRTVRVDLAAPQGVAGESEVEVATRPSPWIQSADPRVVAKAREIVAGAATPAAKVDRIARWVHAEMVQEPAFTLPSTVDVLERLRGDCNEHAALFAGLARAAGVPARVAAGLVYMQGRFYYHAWNEVLLEGRWVPIDPTFGENPAGALRLRLAVGDLGEQMRIASMAGRIRITVREVGR